MQVTSDDHVSFGEAATVLPGALPKLTTSPPDQTPVKPKKGFLDLPPEIRNTIYSLLLGDAVRITIREEQDDNQTRKFSSYAFSGFKFHPSILATCKQVRGEASAILYGANEFAFEFPEHFLDFCSMTNDIGTFMKHIVVEEVADRRAFRSTMNSIADAGSIKKLEFSSLAIQKFSAEDMIEDLKYLVYLLWSERADPEDSLTKEDIVDIFCFADHAECDDELTWGERDLSEGGEYGDGLDEDYESSCDEDEGEEGSEPWVDTWNKEVREGLLEHLRVRQEEDHW